mmetsp:Transcript_528/g.1459  ORF Transcript_528/g.1459 Transcript_528/m.1459 type:complete len:245 (+) Transcript_528:414-1148(+)
MSCCSADMRSRTPRLNSYFSSGDPVAAFRSNKSPRRCSRPAPDRIARRVDVMRAAIDAYDGTLALPCPADVDATGVAAAPERNSSCRCNADGVASALASFSSRAARLASRFMSAFARFSSSFPLLRCSFSFSAWRSFNARRSLSRSARSRSTFILSSRDFCSTSAALAIMRSAASVRRFKSASACKAAFLRCSKPASSLEYSAILAFASRSIAEIDSSRASKFKSLRSHSCLRASISASCRTRA